ncbi:peroxiredoxin-like family protein [Candidatus Spongiihabitans sp.]|uniref:peroxiredoxin-like family protein n=1 Tax=Candidatus Spongiihabitans sp. TaxID=3101308 RepID=UPI003C703193
MTLKTRQPVPELSITTVDGPTWTLSEQQPENFTLIAFYRGLHCPKCKLSLNDLNRKANDFKNLGVTVVAISCDSQARAATAKRDWELDKLTVGYGLSIDSARQCGLYISTSNGMTSIGVEEPELFCEPGLFVILSDGALYMTAIQSMPFARPHFGEVLPALQFIIDKGYPARGEA